MNKTESDVGSNYNADMNNGNFSELSERQPYKNETDTEIYNPTPRRRLSGGKSKISVNSGNTSYVLMK